MFVRAGTHIFDAHTRKSVHAHPRAHACLHSHNHTFSPASRGLVPLSLQLSWPGRNREQMALSIFWLMDGPAWQGLRGGFSGCPMSPSPPQITLVPPSAELGQVGE